MPTKISSEDPIKQPLDSTKAWACLVANLLLWPGLGTVTAGRRVGYAQMAVSLAGFGLTCFWVVWIARRWIVSQEIPEDLGPYFWTCLSGLTLFAIAWTWALASSFFLVMNARPPAKPPRLSA